MQLLLDGLTEDKVLWSLWLRIGEWSMVVSAGKVTTWVIDMRQCQTR